MTDVVAVVGDPPGAGCGMGDFVGVMNAELERRGLTTGLVLTPNLHLTDFARIGRELEALAPRIVHFQFPSISLGKDPVVSLLPRAFRGAPWLITLCEFSLLNPLRQASLALLPRTFDGYIFTSQRELDYCARLNGRLGERSVIIPAVSNIRVVPLPAPPDPAARMARVLYFGQLAPNRGIEDFLAAAERARQDAPHLAFHMVGATPEWARPYWSAIIPAAEAAGVTVRTNVDEAEASHALQQAAFAYFPYPDGAALKRGTLPAALIHDLFLVTRWSDKTEPDVRAASVAAETPGDALAAIERLRQDSDARRVLTEGVEAYKSRYSLPAVTELYLDFYRRFGLTESEAAA